MVEDRNIDMSREALLEENQRLKEYINTLESKISSNCAEKELGPCSVENADLMGPLWDRFQHGLSKDQISRYSRQIVLPSFGIQSQSLLCKGSVLVIGAGGLGSPALMYLAAAGVGRIGIVDQDVVELSNIHRQIIHTEESVGIHKADSAARAISSLNSSIRVDVFKEGFTRENALEIIRGFDVVLDATDNAPSRYLISDVCSICKIPLVSGASIGTDGQLTVYCYGEDGPCYRCLFPKAPAPQSCARCVDAGVLGVLPGIIGVMQALESIKILCKIGDPLSRRLLLVDGLSGKYHVVKLRAKSVNCISCGENAEITAETLQNYDYAKFTGQMPNDAAPGPLKLIEPSDRITVRQLKERLCSENNWPPLVVDVRSSEQFRIGSLPGAVNMPWAQFSKHEAFVQNDYQMLKSKEIYVVCRRGNDSQRAVSRLREMGLTNAIDVVGGMEAWAKHIDPTFPLY